MSGKEADSDDEAKGSSKRDDDDDPEEDRAVLQEVFDWYYSSDELEETLQKWAVANCDSFDRERSARGVEEFKLEHTRLFDEFRELFEKKIEACIRSRGCSVQRFFRIVRDDRRSPAAELYSGTTFVAVINAACEFKTFHTMMCDAKDGDFCWGVPIVQDADTGELLM